MKRLDGRVAIVTGGAGAMGEQVVRRLGQEGAIVVAAGRNADAAGPVIDRLHGEGLVVEFVRTDVGEESDVEKAVSSTVERFGQLDIVVNNAAATDIVRSAEGEGLIVAEPTEVFARMLRVNLFGPFWFAKYAVPAMRAAGGGAFINISSVHAVQATEGSCGYAVSKAGLEALTRQIAIDYGGDNIRANVVRIGSIRTAHNAKSHDDPVAAALRRSLRATPDVGRPEDLADLVAFLASDESRYITAAVIPLDGGALSKYAGSSPTSMYGSK